MHFIRSGDVSRLQFSILKVLTLTNLQVCCWLLFCTNSARNCSNPRKHRTRSTLFLHLQLFVTSCSAEPLYCAPLKTLRHRALDPSMSHSHLYIGWMRVFQRFLEHFFSMLVHLVISPRILRLTADRQTDSRQTDSRHNNPGSGSYQQEMIKNL